MNDVSLKRKHEEPLDPNKKQKPCFTELTQLPEDMLGRICSFLQFDDLTALSYLSKEWVVITARTPFWRDLCAKSELTLQTEELARPAFMYALCEKNPKALLASARFFSESKNIFSDINIQKALSELHAALSDRKISTDARLEVDIRIAFLHAAQTRFRYGTPIHSSEAAAKRLQWVVNSNISPTMCAAANALFAELRISNRPTMLTDVQAFALLQGVSQNPSAADWIRAQADLQMAIMRLENRTNLITEEQAFALLQSISQNPSAANSIRVEADLTMAKMRIQKRTNLITDDLAFALLQGVSQNPAASALTRAQADFDMARMRFRNRTNLITDDHAFALLQGVRQNPAISDLRRAQGGLEMAKMRLQNRTNIITDDQAFALLQGVSQNPAASILTRAHADVALARMRLQNRTNRITDEQAFALLQGVSQNLEAGDAIQSEARALLDSIGR